MKTKNIPKKFYRTASLVNQLSEHKAGGTLGAFLKKLGQAEVIILDEFGYTLRQNRIAASF